MTKIEMAHYLVNLLTIITSKDAAGHLRGGSLAREYERVYAEFTDTLKKEEDNETRSS